MSMSVWSVKKKEETNNIHIHSHIHTATQYNNCSECASTILYKKGMRYSKQRKPIQPYLRRAYMNRFKIKVAQMRNRYEIFEFTIHEINYSQVFKRVKARKIIETRQR